MQPPDLLRIYNLVESSIGKPNRSSAKACYMNKRHLQYNEKLKNFCESFGEVWDAWQRHLGMSKSCLSQSPFHTVRSLIQGTKTSRNFKTLLFLISWNYILNSCERLVDNLVESCVLPEGQMGLCHLPKPKPWSWDYTTFWLEALCRVDTHWSPTGEEREASQTCWGLPIQLLVSFLRSLTGGSTHVWNFNTQPPWLIANMAPGLPLFLLGW